MLYCKGSKETQEMYIRSHMTGAIAIVEPNRQLTMKVAPIYKKFGGDLSYALLNGSNSEFAPAMDASGMLDHFPMLETHRNVPDIAIKGIELTPELLEGMGVTQSHMRMMALSMMMPCEYFKEWIEGSTDDRETLVRFEAEYGQTRGTWLR